MASSFAVKLPPRAITVPVEQAYEMDSPRSTDEKSRTSHEDALPFSLNTTPRPKTVDFKLAPSPSPTTARVVVALADADDFENNCGLKRELRQRHLQMIALSATVGSGLFLGGATALSTSGPLGALLAYAIIASVVFSVAISMAELTAFAPVAGGFSWHASRFLDPAIGFSVGWYWMYSSAMLVALQVTAGQVLLSFWVDKPWLKPFFTAILLSAMIATNCLPTRYFGELQVFAGCLKLLTITGLIIMGLLIDWGANPQRDVIGFRYWRDPAPMASYIFPGAKGRFVGLVKTLSQASFSFQGIEIISVAAGQARNARYAVPTATRRLFFRVVIAYLAGLFACGLIVASNDPDLGSTETAGTALRSPFVIATRRAGVAGLPSLVNALVFLSAFSSGESYLFAASRLLQGLAARRQAPAIFATTTRQGMPIFSILACSSFGLLAFMNVKEDSSVVFGHFSNITTQAGYVCWLTIVATWVSFARGMKRQGLERTKLLYHGPLQPYAAYWAVGWLIFLIFSAGFTSFIGGFDFASFATSYVGLPLAFGLFFVYKVKNGSQFWRAGDIDYVSGIPTLAQTEGSTLPACSRWDRLLKKL